MDKGKACYSKNQNINLSITDLGAEGEGIGKVDGYTFFVKDGLPGDEIEAKIIKVKKNYAYARLERVVKPSPFRVNPVCEHARRCGGCQIMEMQYDKQLEFKQNKIKNNLVRIGGFNVELIDSIMEPIVGMEEPLRYRNKAQYPVGCDKEGKPITGFYAGRTHSIIPNLDCHLSPEVNKDILSLVLEHMAKYNITAYDEMTGEGLIRHVLIRQGRATEQIMVCFVINGNQIDRMEELCDRLSKISGMTSISISINKKNTNVILGDNYKTVWGEQRIVDCMKVKVPSGQEWVDINDGLTFAISPLSFYQVNPVQVEKLYGVAIDYASLNENDEVWDICCGIGTITLSMASRCRKVHGIEIVPQAIEDAKENAKRNNIANAEFICAAAEDYLPKHSSEIKADVVVMDPPRKGMDEEALKVVVQANPQRIVYISCDSATLARDLKFLCENGYELKRVRGCDMFGQSVHVETVVLMSKVK